MNSFISSGLGHSRLPMFFFALQRASQSHKSLKVIRIIISVETQLKCGQAEYTSVYKLQVMHMYPSAATGLSSRTCTPGGLSRFRPCPSLFKIGYRLTISLPSLREREVHNLFVLEIRQTNPSKPSKADFNEMKQNETKPNQTKPNQTKPNENLVTDSKYYSQTLPSSVFPGDIIMGLQFRIKSGMDRTWHNTAHCQVSNPKLCIWWLGEDIRKHESDKPYVGNELWFQCCLWPWRKLNINCPTDCTQKSVKRKKI